MALSKKQYDEAIKRRDAGESDDEDQRQIALYESEKSGEDQAGEDQQVGITATGEAEVVRPAKVTRGRARSGDEN